MKYNGTIFIQFIEEGSDHILSERLVSNTPNRGDLLRFGGEGNELIYKVTRIIWIYDEPNNSYERVNVGIELSMQH